MQTGHPFQASSKCHVASIQLLDLPEPALEVLPGIAWGCASEWFTPAFWKFQSSAMRAKYTSKTYRLGRTFREEVAVCLLGGHGLPAELGLAAFDRLRDRNLLHCEVEQSQLEEALTEPLDVGGRWRRYRFPRQKAKYLWHALQAVETIPDTLPPKHLRNHLTLVPGIGPKTASWVVRNHFSSNEVAILDVHILRAGATMGLFSADADPAKHYFELEDRFLEFCDAIEEPASQLDALMWDFMRRIGPTSGSRRKHRQLELELSQ